MNVWESILKYPRFKLEAVYKQDEGNGTARWGVIWQDKVNPFFEEHIKGWVHDQAFGAHVNPDDLIDGLDRREITHTLIDYLEQLINLDRLYYSELFGWSIPTTWWEPEPKEEPPDWDFYWEKRQ